MYQSFQSSETLDMPSDDHPQEDPLQSSWSLGVLLEPCPGEK